MYVQKYYCDHCGKEINDKTDYSDIILDIGYDDISTDLCQSCIQDLTEIVREFCSAQKDKEQ